jgi:hypothetical protein
VKTPAKSDLTELLTSLQSQSDSRVRETLAALEVGKVGPDGNQTLLSQLPSGYKFLTGYDHTVLNSVFTPQIKEGEEVTTPDGVVQGKLALKIKALMYSPQALNQWATTLTNTTTPGAIGTDQSPAWQLVAVKLAAPSATSVNGGGTGDGGGELAIVLERPVNHAALMAALTNQYQTFSGHPAQLAALADSLRKLSGVESCQLVLPSGLAEVSTPNPGSDPGVSNTTANNPDPVLKVALEFVGAKSSGQTPASQAQITAK